MKKFPIAQECQGGTRCFFMTYTYESTIKKRRYGTFRLVQILGFGCWTITPSVDVEEQEELAGEKHLKKMVQSTADYLNEHDKHELLELIEGIEKEE